jgi:hypothetical protein
MYHSLKDLLQQSLDKEALLSEIVLENEMEQFGYSKEKIYEKLEERYAGTLIGNYISYFRNKDCSTVEKKALYYGLQALLQTSKQ